MFNEQFFMYSEDLDFKRRMDEKHLSYGTTKRVNTHHIIGATSINKKDIAEEMNKSKAVLDKVWGV